MRKINIQLAYFTSAGKIKISKYYINRVRFPRYQNFVHFTFFEPFLSRFRSLLLSPSLLEL